MVSNRVPGFRNTANECTMPVRRFANDKESAARALALQQLDQFGRRIRMRPVIKCQRGQSLVRCDTCNRAQNRCEAPYTRPPIFKPRLHF
jgi:hypothetical protein